MRDLKDCQAEVFRRSEERIRKRIKRRRQILSLCIPLVICLGIFSVTVLHNGLNGIRAGDGFTMGSADSSYICSYETVTVQASDTPEKVLVSISDRAAVAKAYCAVFAFDDPSDKGDGNDKNMNFSSNIEGAPMDSPAPLRGYIITFSTAEGAQTLCTLDGNKLYYSKENRFVTLTDSEVLEIKLALGLSDK